MDADPKLARLPDSYALALRLRDAGADDVHIAESVGVEPAAVGPLLLLASAKLRTLTGEEGVDDDPGP